MKDIERPAARAAIASLHTIMDKISNSDPEVIGRNAESWTRAVKYDIETIMSYLRLNVITRFDEPLIRDLVLGGDTLVISFNNAFGRGSLILQISDRGRIKFQADKRLKITFDQLCS